MSDSPQGWQYPQPPTYPQDPVTPGYQVAPSRPLAMQRAFILMFVGAATGLIAGVIGGVAAHVVLPADSTTSPDTAALDTSALHSFFIVAGIISGCITAGLWLWMAWKTGSGRSWARVLSTVFFGIECLSALGGIATVGITHSFLPAIASLAHWGVGLAAIIYLWKRESSDFFAFAQQERLAQRYGQGYMPPQYGQPQYGQPPRM
jgi:hypothetical protein